MTTASLESASVGQGQSMSSLRRVYTNSSTQILLISLITFCSPGVPSIPSSFILQCMLTAPVVRFIMRSTRWEEKDRSIRPSRPTPTLLYWPRPLAWLSSSLARLSIGSALECAFSLEDGDMLYTRGAFCPTTVCIYQTSDPPLRHFSIHIDNGNGALVIASGAILGVAASFL